MMLIGPYQVGSSTGQVAARCWMTVARRQTAKTFTLHEGGQLADLFATCDVWAVSSGGSSRGDAQTAHEENGHQPHLRLVRRIFLEVQRDRNGKDNDVEDHVGSRVALEGDNKVSRLLGAKAITLGVGREFLPHVGNWEARDPSHEGVCEAPQADDHNEDDTEASDGRASLEDPEVLEKQRQLDEGRRGDIAPVADVEQLLSVGISRGGGHSRR